jgi:hypothetical protein
MIMKNFGITFTTLFLLAGLCTLIGCQTGCQPGASVLSVDSSSQSQVEEFSPNTPAGGKVKEHMHASLGHGEEAEAKYQESLTKLRAEPGAGQSARSNSSQALLCSASPICPGKFYPLTQYEGDKGAGSGIISDRNEYWMTDSAALLFFFYGSLNTSDYSDKRIRLELRDQSRALLKSVTVTSIEGPKLDVLVDVAQLEPGQYNFRGRVETNAGQSLLEKEITVTKINKYAPTGDFPAEGVAINVHTQSHVANARWPIATGIPMPQGAIRTLDRLAILENGTRIPAQFTIRATWGPRGDIKWLGVDFVARYDADVPRNYKLVLMSKCCDGTAPTTPLAVTTTTSDYIVNTGAARFLVNRTRFAGIEKAWLDLNADGQFQNTELVINGVGGPFLVDETGTLYAAVNKAQNEVEIEEAGPVRVTLVAKGWYTSVTGAQLCKFATRMSFYAGEAYATISHRTVITYDTRTLKRLADVGWQFTTRETIRNWVLGGDSTSVSGRFPSLGSSVFVHQDKANHYRVMQDTTLLGQGSRADGWMTYRNDRAAASLLMRDVYQKYPKELEINNNATSPHVTVVGEVWRPKLTAHFWPKHGHVAYTEQEELARGDIYKMRYAHQGSQMNFNIPSNYISKLQEWDASPDGPDRAWDAEGQIHQAAIANAQGVAIGNEFMLYLHTVTKPPSEVRQWTKLYQQSPHALSSPEWNASTEIDGKWAARDPNFFPHVERYIDLSWPRYQKYVIENKEEYGMWAYGDVHNDWDPARGVAPLHRVWQASHYQNVWAGWFLYLRSGSPEFYQWAKLNSDHFRDTETINYDRQTCSFGVRYAGGQMHCKGFLPWGGQQGPGDHWVDGTNYILRYYLTGDGHSKDLMQLWGQDMSRYIQTAAYGQPHPAQTCAEVSGTTLRQYLPELADMVAYYEATYDAQILHSIYNNQSLDKPFECTLGAWIHPVIHPNWINRYYGLTRDPRVMQRLLAWHAAGHSSVFANAFLYQQTGDVSYLTSKLPEVYDFFTQYYDNPTDPMHGYSSAVVNNQASLIREVPYFLRAMKDAGLQPSMGQRAMAYPSQGSPFTVDYSIYRNSRGWSASGLTVLLPRLGDGKVHLRYKKMSDFPGLYKLLDHSNPSPGYFIERWQLDPVSKDMTVNENLTRLECNGYRCGIEVPISRAADGVSSTPEVLVLPKDTFINGKWIQAEHFGDNRMLFYMRPYSNRQVVQLRFDASASGFYSGAPSYIRIEDANGAVAFETNLFGFGTRSSATVTLDPVRSPLPWKFYSHSLWGPFIKIENNTEELFFAKKASDLDAVLPLITFPP